MKYIYKTANKTTFFPLRIQQRPNAEIIFQSSTGKSIAAQTSFYEFIKMILYKYYIPCAVDSRKYHPEECDYQPRHNIIPRNVIINRGAASVDNHISRDDIFDYHPSRKCNIYFIIPNRTLDPLFSEVLLLLNI